MLSWIFTSNNCKRNKPIEWIELTPERHTGCRHYARPLRDKKTALNIVSEEDDWIECGAQSPWHSALSSWIRVRLGLEVKLSLQAHSGVSNRSAVLWWPEACSTTAVKRGGADLEQSIIRRCFRGRYQCEAATPAALLHSNWICLMPVHVERSARQMSGNHTLWSPGRNLKTSPSRNQMHHYNVRLLAN